jgi:pseudouridine-5'-phosphate glycosidase
VRHRRPRVALETTVVTHGLPRPLGLRVARELLAEVERQGALPVTIGVLRDGAKAGLTPAQLEELAQAEDVAKLNLGNLAAAIAAGRLGSTTVAATMLLAHDAGIHVMATGGIGGVHRGAARTGDVSADLFALARIPVAVVCSGAKAVLDLPRTREALETLGVPVFGFGADRFPAFYRRDSGLPVDARFDDVAALAKAIRVHFGLRLTGGVLVVNPVPAGHELPLGLYRRGIRQALLAASRKGVAGRDVTPFLLDRLRELTKGKSVLTNRALLLDNARLAARLALALEKQGHY